MSRMNQLASKTAQTRPKLFVHLGKLSDNAHIQGSKYYKIVDVFRWYALTH
ncbi:hypothetical protein [Anabaena sp. CCY 9614]|uniref:hypothetical protein n=1 Tax=Anabaena sp. CCY 9614 TaxID=3103869 RepID=UPI0039C5C56D